MNDETRHRVRLWVALLVTVIEIALGLALFSGWTPPRWGHAARELATIRPISVAPLPKVAPARQPRTARKAGAASPPNLLAHPVEVVAPRPVLLPIPVPVATAPKAAQGIDPSAGASAIAGPGTGAGGSGIGSGSGSAGNGDGDGGDDTPPRLLKGRLKNSDYPAAAGEAGVGGTVSVRYVVETDGRVSDCDITRSSGSPILDETTCRLIRERFRFQPSRDAQGRAVPSAIVENHSWFVQHDDAPPGAQR